MSYHSPSLEYTLDDRDLDDAELWAVIDSAATSKSRKTQILAIKNSNPTPRVSRDEGLVVQRSSPKIARQTTPDQRMAVVKSSFRSPATCTPSPPSNLTTSHCSPLIESPRSPAAGNWWCAERKENLVPTPHSLSGMFPSVSLFKQYQNAAMEILEKTDYIMISGSPFIKKSGWRKISFYFNLSFEIRDKTIEFDENRNVQRAEFVVRALMQGGRFADGWGSCERREKRFLKPNHDIPSTAETRAKNRACQDLLGIGEYRPGVKV